MPCYIYILAFSLHDSIFLPCNTCKALIYLLLVYSSGFVSCVTRTVYRLCCGTSWVTLSNFHAKLCLAFLAALCQALKLIPHPALHFSMDLKSKNPPLDSCACRSLASILVEMESEYNNFLVWFIWCNNDPGKVVLFITQKEKAAVVISASFSRPGGWSRLSLYSLWALV